MNEDNQAWLNVGKNTFQGSAPVGIAIADVNANIIDCDTKITEILGFTDKEEFLEFTKEHWFKTDRSRAAFQFALDNGSVRAELKALAKNDTIGPFEVFMLHVKALNQIIIHLYDIREDIEEILKNESFAKTQFLARMSHDMRTPLNTIIGVSDIQLRKSQFYDPEIAESFNKIRQSSDVLLALINDAFDLSKLESKDFVIESRPYDVAGLILDVAQTSTVQYDKNDVVFELSVDENLPRTAVGDAARIRQVISHLLSNAYKYTVAGTVSLSVEPAQDGDRHGMAVVVEDTGRGMSTQQAKTLLACQYASFNKTLARQLDGTWMGMNIVQRIISRMDGKIQVESRPRKGTKFSVFIPMRLTSSATLGKKAAWNLENFQAGKTTVKLKTVMHRPMPHGKVLIVDDVTSNLYVAGKLMEAYQLQVTSVTSGEEALALILEGEAFDVIFMDHMMPDMDGVETTKAIHETGYTKPIVALSANVVLGQAELYKEYGFAAFLGKPIDVEKLDDILTVFVKDRHTKREHNMPKENGKFINGTLRECVNRDARKVHDILVDLMGKTNWREDDYEAFTLNTHGIKSALASIHHMELSTLAATLEQAGKSRDKLLIQSKSLSLIKGLRNLIDETSAEEEKECLGPGSDDLLFQKLGIINDACQRYNKKDAWGALSELTNYTWPEDIRQLISNLNACMPHSEFKNMSGIVQQYLAS